MAPPFSSRSIKAGTRVKCIHFMLFHSFNVCLSRDITKFMYDAVAYGGNYLLLPFVFCELAQRTPSIFFLCTRCHACPTVIAEDTGSGNASLVMGYLEAKDIETTAIQWL